MKTAITFRPTVRKMIEVTEGDDREFLAMNLLFSSNLKIRELVTMKYEYLFKKNERWRRIFYHPVTDRKFTISRLKRKMLQQYVRYYELEEGDYLFFNRSNPKRHIAAVHLKLLLNDTMKKHRLRLVSDRVFKESRAYVKGKLR